MSSPHDAPLTFVHGRGPGANVPANPVLGTPQAETSPGPDGETQETIDHTVTVGKPRLPAADPIAANGPVSGADIGSQSGGVDDIGKFWNRQPGPDFGDLAVIDPDVDPFAFAVQPDPA